MGRDYYCAYCHKSLECCKCDGQLQDDIATAQERIAELETENAKLREALKRVAKTSCYCEVRSRCLSCDAKKALGGEG
jgi:hypothetical protein